MRRVLLAALLWLTPRAAEACSACYYARDQVNAYLLPTLLMLLVPAMLIGGLCAMLWLATTSVKPSA